MRESFQANEKKKNKNEGLKIGFTIKNASHNYITFKNARYVY